MAQPSTFRRDQAKRKGTVVRFLACVVAAAIVTVGIVGVVIPDTLITLRTNAVSPASIYTETVIKIAIGLVLILAAPSSRATGILWCIGAAAVLGGVAIPIFGVESARQRLAWEAAHLTFFRLEAAFFVLLGVLIFSMVRPINSHDEL